MRVVFMGTPDFAVPTLKALIGAHDVVGVVTQPDKRKGRGKAYAFSPVKETALAHGIPVWQPVRVREEDFLTVLREAAPDIIVVAAFGQILPEAILNLPPYGCINVHASLLPRFRGAAPIQWSILEGDEETGVTIMYMEKGLDTGDMIDRVRIPIEPGETGASLHDKLADAGAPLLLSVMDDLARGEARREKQRDEDSTYAPMLTKELGHISWEEEAARIERLVRAMNSWPSAYTELGGKTLKIWGADVADPAPETPEAGQEDLPGTIVRVTKEAFYVQTGQGLLKIREVQLQGKKRMPVQAFLLGYPLKEGMQLG